MAIKQNALTYLPQISIEAPSGNSVSLESLKGAIYQVVDFQKKEIASGLYAGIPVNRKTPFTGSTWTISKGTMATGTVTLATSLANDTVTINGLVYTAVSGAKADNTEFSIDGNDTVDAADLADSINNDVRVGTLGVVSATSALGVVTLLQTAGGVAGDATTLVSSDGGTLAVSGATFSGGADGEVYYLNFVSENIVKQDGGSNRRAISSRRALDIEIVENGNLFTARSILAVLEAIEGLENKKDTEGHGSGTITLATALADDTVTVNGLVYTAVTGAKADNTEFSIDGTDTVDAADLADSINNDVRTGTIGVVSATSAAGVVTVTTNLRGESGNATTLAEDTGSTTITISGATFTGGGADGSFSGAVINGFTPYETFTWDLVKLANVYTATPTASS